MDPEVVYETIRACMRTAVEAETGVREFSYSLKPNKSLVDGGLALQPPNWRMLLRALQEDYLPQEAPYQAVAFDEAVATRTYPKSLSDTCVELATLLIAG
jgi:hypothetical protein